MEEVLIYRIPLHSVRYLYNEWDKERPVSHSLFLSKNKDNIYIAIDNEADGFEIKEFKSYEKALCWLCRKDYSWEEICGLDDIYIRRLMRNNKYRVIHRYKINNGLSF